MKIEHTFAWPSRFPTSRDIGQGSVQVFQKIIKQYFPSGGKGWADPMCGRDSRCEFRNDIRNKGTAGLQHEDALEWLKKIPSYSISGVMYDPPYNDKQGEKYTNLHHSKSDLRYWWSIRREIGRILKPGGVVLMFNWNTNTFPACQLEVVHVVAHGSERHDTLISLHRKSPNRPLWSYLDSLERRG